MRNSKCVRGGVCFVLALAILVSLCGCAGLSASRGPGRFLSRRDPEFQRAYDLYVPSRYRPQQQWPLVVICHDSGLFEGPDSAIGEWKRTVEKQGALLAAPDFVHRSAGADDLPPDKAVFEDEGFILSVIRSVRAAYSVDDMQIFLVGSGTGSYPALYTALRHPNMIRAVSVRQPSFKPEWLDPCVPFLDLYQPIQVLYDPRDIFSKRDAENCIDWLIDHDLNVTTVKQTGSRRDAPAIFAFVSQVLRRQPLIRIQLRDDPDNSMAVQFRILTSLKPKKVRWDFGDGSGSTEREPSHTYRQEGRYKVKLEVWPSGDQPQMRQVEVRIPRVWLGARQPSTKTNN